MARTPRTGSAGPAGQGPESRSRHGHLIGAELELWLFDGSGRARNRAADVIEGFERDVRPHLHPEVRGLIGELHYEFDRSSVEIGCKPSETLAEVGRSLTATLTAVDGYARRLGLRALPYGVRLDGNPLIVDKPRYLIQNRIFGFWFREMLLPLAGLHIHVDLAEDERVAGDQFRLANALRPVLISFNACTPIFNGRLTRYTSARTHYYKLTYEENGLPKNGCLLDLDGVQTLSDFRRIAQHAYRDIIARINAKGIRNWEPYFDAINTIWGGVREGRYGTVESRISDAHPQLEYVMAALALHRGMGNLLTTVPEPFRITTHPEKCFYSIGRELAIPRFEALRELEYKSLTSLYPRGGYNGVHPDCMALCATALKFAKAGLDWKDRRFLRPYERLVLGDEETLSCRVTRFALEEGLLRERDLSFVPGGSNRLRLHLYEDVYRPSLRWAQEEFGVEPDLVE